MSNNDIHDNSKARKPSCRLSINFLLNEECSVQHTSTKFPKHHTESEPPWRAPTSCNVTNDGAHRSPDSLLPNCETLSTSAGDPTFAKNTLAQLSQNEIGNVPYPQLTSSHPQTSNLEDIDGAKKIQRTLVNQTSTPTTSYTSTFASPIPPPRRVINRVPCDECRSLFFNHEAVQRHKRVTHTAKSTKELVTCSECKLVLRSEENLARHAIIHGPGANIKCKRCPTRFLNKRSLTSHLRIVHRHGSSSRCKPKASWICGFDGCNYASSQQTNTIRHYRKVHLGICDHKCPQCDYCTNTSTNLSAHMLKHRKNGL